MECYKLKKVSLVELVGRILDLSSQLFYKVQFGEDIAFLTSQSVSCLSKERVQRTPVTNLELDFFFFFFAHLCNSHFYPTLLHTYLE